MSTDNATELRAELTKATEKLSAYKFPWPTFVVVAILLGSFAGFQFSTEFGRDTDPFDAEKIILFIVMTVVAGSMYSAMFVGGYYQYKKRKLESSRQDILSNLISTETEVLQDDLKEDFFTNLVKINFKYIDKYYLQTQLQAEKSFVITASVAVIGFMFVLLGVAMMYFGQDANPGYVTTGAGVIGEFIAAVFFYLYNKTIIKMGDYHQKLVLTQNVSLALKIADGLPSKEKTEAKKALVEYLSKDINVFLSSLNNKLNTDAR